MRISFKNNVRKFQQGGPMEAAPAEEAPQEEGQEAPMEEGQEAPQEGQEDPMQQLAQMFAQGLQNQDCQMLAQGAQMFLQLLQGGGQEEPQSEPVFRRGGILAYRIRK